MKRLRSRADAVGLRLGRPIPRRMPWLLLLLGLALGSMTFAYGDGAADAGPRPRVIAARNTVAQAVALATSLWVANEPYVSSATELCSKHPEIRKALEESRRLETIANICRLTKAERFEQIAALPQRFRHEIAIVRIGDCARFSAFLSDFLRDRERVSRAYANLVTKWLERAPDAHPRSVASFRNELQRVEIDGIETACREAEVKLSLVIKLIPGD